MIEEYDVSRPGSLFQAAVREPDLMKVGTTELKAAIAEDWVAIGSPMPTAEQLKGLSASERQRVGHMIQVLQLYATTAAKNETVALQQELKSMRVKASKGNGRVRKSVEIDRDANSKITGIRSLVHD